MGCIQGPRIFWRRDEDSPQSPTKFNMMGIGAERQRDPNGIAWKQNKEFGGIVEEAE